MSSSEGLMMTTGFLHAKTVLSSTLGAVCCVRRRAPAWPAQGHHQWASTNIRYVCVKASMHVKRNKSERVWQSSKLYMQAGRHMSYTSKASPDRTAPSLRRVFREFSVILGNGQSWQPNTADYACGSGSQQITHLHAVVMNLAIYPWLITNEVGLNDSICIAAQVRHMTSQTLAGGQYEKSVVFCMSQRLV